MNPDPSSLRHSIAVAAGELPRSVIEELCDALEHLADDAPPGQRAALPAIIASPRARSRVADLIETWSTMPQVSPTSLAWALRAASDMDELRRSQQSIELVWTGPSPEGTTLRRTDQVLLDLIHSARRTLHIVTFVAYKIPTLSQALLVAARRGVEVSLIFESEDANKVSFTASEAIGEELEALCDIYVWPARRRPRDPAGRHGSLHAKCAVADADAVLISSANLTEYALNLNMELGLFVRGGDMPRRLVEHLRRLIDENVLIPVLQEPPPPSSDPS